MHKRRQRKWLGKPVTPVETSLVVFLSKATVPPVNKKMNVVVVCVCFVFLHVFFVCFLQIFGPRFFFGGGEDPEKQALKE